LIHFKFEIYVDIVESAFNVELKANSLDRNIGIPVFSRKVTDPDMIISIINTLKLIGDFL
jgi:hypothetical protein